MSEDKPNKHPGNRLYIRNARTSESEQSKSSLGSRLYVRQPGMTPPPASPEDTQPDIPKQDEPTTLLRQQDAPTAREQEPERYQPPTGYSRLGRDMQTGDYVDVAQAARLRGLYIIGLQGYGKSGLNENLIIQDIKQNIGVCVLDPHGELIKNIIARLPDREKEEKVILLDLKRKDAYIGLNLFDCADPTDDDEITKTLDLVKHVFEKAFEITQATPLMYNLLYKIAYVLIANPGSTMVDMPLFLTNEAFRKKLVHNVTDYDVRTFWENWDNPKLKSPRDQEADSQTILNKLNDFSHAPLRYIVGQSSSTIDLQKIMDEGKILLVKLDRRRVTATALIGSILVALTLTASDARLTKKQFNVYADEFQRFASEDFATLLEEARKAGIGITMAHQNRSQLSAKDKELETDLKDRTRSTDNLVVFRINRKDADDLAGEFAEEPEKAKVDVLTPQKHQRIEEQVEIEVEEDIMEITHDPVNYLASYSHTHPSSIVRGLIWKLILPIREAEQQPNIPKYIMKKIQGVHEQINLLLIAVMEEEIQPHSEQLVNTVREIVTRYNRIEGVLGIKWGYIPIPNMDTYLLQLCKELAKAPIKVPTGQKKMVKRKEPRITYLTHESEKIQHPRRPEQDVVNEMARTITNLPPYTARAKITIKTGPDEYTIKTLEIKTLDPKKHSERPLHGQALQERIDSIREQNRQGGYVRPRHEVEEEIRTRQEQYRKPPEAPPVTRRPQREPRHKQEVVPPPEDEPPVTRRQRN